MSKLKKLPYGISDFEQVIGRNYYFVDKTTYLPLIEDSRDNLLFIRPRRFGKSLFVGMLSTYYDILQKDRFDEVFGNLWIGQHPTEERNSYQILRFDFSKVGGVSSLEELKESFDAYCGGIVDEFAEKYAAFYRPTFVEEIKKKPTA
ncbi:MAG: AAA family ATPase, partial [Prevotellaceae bacterium]|nr:AAA family ATPase [Prevotellaceae bacterium]